MGIYGGGMGKGKERDQGLVEERERNMIEGIGWGIERSGGGGLGVPMVPIFLSLSNHIFIFQSFSFIFQSLNFHQILLTVSNPTFSVNLSHISQPSFSLANGLFYIQIFLLYHPVFLHIPTSLLSAHPFDIVQSSCLIFQSVPLCSNTSAFFQPFQVWFGRVALVGVSWVGAVGLSQSRGAELVWVLVCCGMVEVIRVGWVGRGKLS